MINSSNSATELNKKAFESKFTLFKNLSRELCCSLEEIIDLFDTFSESQKNQFLKEIENTKQNIFSVSALLGYKNKNDEVDENNQLSE